MWLLSSDAVVMGAMMVEDALGRFVIERDAEGVICLERNTDG